KVFIENKANLYAFFIEIVTHGSYEGHKYFNDVLELILQNPNFIIKELYVHIRSNNQNIIKENISRIINLQNNLKKVFFEYGSLSFYQSILDSNCSNTLNKIVFYHVNFKYMINLNKVFEQLNVLESVHIVYCRSLDSNIIQ